MRLALILALAFVVVPACKSHKQPADMEQMQKEAPDAKPTLHVAEDDPRYVATTGTTARQVHYYSAENDMTYVIDENTGKVVTTHKGKQMPGVVIVDKPAYQPPPLEKRAAEGCGEAKETEVEEVKETAVEEVPEGCGCGQ